MYKALRLSILIVFYFLTFKIPLAFSLEPLNLDKLSFHNSHPETYSLLIVDSREASLPDSRANWNAHEDFKNIGPLFLRSSLASDLTVSFAKSIEEATLKDKWIIRHTQKVTEKDCHTVQLLKKNQALRAVNLMDTLTTSVLSKPDELSRPNKFIFQAALIIFPYLNNQAMVYGIGRWNMLLKPSCIIPQWGLHMLASSNMSNPDQVKQVLTTYHRTANPSKRSEKLANPANIESFGLEVGSEGLSLLTGLAGELFKTSRIVKAGDYFQFTITPTISSNPEVTIQSLEKIATHLLEVKNDKNFHIHERMKEFIDEELKDEKMLAQLNEKLLNLIRSEDGKFQVFPHTSLWGEQQTKTLLFGEEKSRSLLDVLSKIDPSNLSLKVKIWKGKSENFTEVEILQFLYSNPIEYEKSFFRFEKGHWYAVDASRFEPIKRIMRSFKLNQDSLKLPFYSFTDTERSHEKTIDYKEANYNARAVKVVSNEKGWRAILLDRLNVSLGAGKHLFEFADLLLSDNENFYIVHIKRAGASQLSHHREQVERCAEFLATELNKSEAKNLLLKGVINSLYQDYEVPPSKVKGQGTNLTRGDLFQSLSTQGSYLQFGSKGSSQNKKKTTKRKTTTFKQHLASTLLKAKKTDEDPLKTFKNEVKHKIDYNFFEKRLKELAISLDALFDCIKSIKEQKKEINTPTIEEMTGKFFESVKQAITAQDILFSNGILKKKNPNQIKIVLAVIDDRNIERHLSDLEKIKGGIVEEPTNNKKKQNNIAKLEELKNKLEQKSQEKATLKVNQKNKNPLFKNQDLWGLDKTKNIVQSHGLDFNLIIINEDDAPVWDAFGEIIQKKKNADEAFSPSSHDSHDAQQSPSAPPPSSTTEKLLDLAALFKIPAIDPGKLDKIDVSKSQPLSFSGAIDPASGLYASYITCPTVGDGDCFFHAVFTEDGENAGEVKRQAAEMRDNFCNAVQKGKYIKDCRDLLYEDYLHSSTSKQYHKIPENIAKTFEENHRYEKARKDLISLGIPLAQLGKLAIAESLFSPEEIKDLISEDIIKIYMEQLRIAGGEETYIPVRPGMQCPAAAIAIENHKKINIFTFNKATKMLDLLKSVGIDGDIVNVLIEGNHFTRLLNVDENGRQHLQATQIMKNYAARF